MIRDYVYWQYVWAPTWLAQVTVTVQKGLLQFFSVPLMLRTLVSHWHRDMVPYRGGTIGRLIITFGWNQISRAVGFIIRSCVLMMWLFFEILFVVVVVTVWLLFLLWPLMIITTIVGGLGLIISG